MEQVKKQHPSRHVPGTDQSGAECQVHSQMQVPASFCVTCVAWWALRDYFFFVRRLSVRPSHFFVTLFSSHFYFFTFSNNFCFVTRCRQVTHVLRGALHSSFLVQPPCLTHLIPPRMGTPHYRRSSPGLPPLARPNVQPTVPTALGT